VVHVRRKLAGAIPPPPPTKLKSGDKVTVAADGSCLNLRAGAGLTFPILTCLAEGTPLTVNGTPVAVVQFNWVPVTLQSGQTGWVAEEYLQPAPTIPAAPKTRIVVINVAGG